MNKILVSLGFFFSLALVALTGYINWPIPSLIAGAASLLFLNWMTKLFMRKVGDPALERARMEEKFEGPLYIMSVCGMLVGAGGFTSVLISAKYGAEGRIVLVSGLACLSGIATMFGAAWVYRVRRRS